MSWSVQKIIISRFLSGFICWYSIEKIFERSIGISVFGISVLAIIYISTSVILNVPTGVFADRYGRKYALLLAVCALFLTTVMAAKSHNFFDYAIVTFLWGIFYTTQNGAYEAILYDTLKEEGREKKYAKYSSWSGAGFWMAIFISSIIGAFVGSHFGLRWAFIITIVPNVINIFVTAALREPKVHASEKPISSYKMIGQGFKFLSSSSVLINLSVVFLIIEMVGWSINEYDQLFFIEIGLGVLAIGILNGVSGLFQAGGSFFGYRFGEVPNKTIVLTLAACFIGIFALPPSMRILALGLLLITVFLVHAFYISNNARLQHLLPSEIRATSISSLGMINDVVLVFAYLSFGILSRISNVRTSFMAFVFWGIILLFIAKYMSTRAKNSKELVKNQDDLMITEADSVPK